MGELQLPATQAGSSMMPSKVNPVIAESPLMVCAQVIGHDAAIFWCAAAFVEQSLAMATALAKEASATGRTIREVARERSGISSAELERLLDPRSQT